MLEYLNHLLNVNSKIIASIEKNTNRDYNGKIAAIQKKNEKIKELMKN